MFIGTNKYHLIFHPILMIVYHRLLLFLFLLSFPSAMKAGGFGSKYRGSGVKHVCEEGARLGDEVAREEGFINELPLNAAEVAPHVTEESAFIEPSSMDVDSIAEPKSSLPEPEELGSQKRQRVASLDEIFMDDISTEIRNNNTPIAANLGNRILSFSPDIIFQFLRSPVAKQTDYKQKYQQAVEELQEKYPNLANEIAVWKDAVEEWSECRIPQKKEALYQSIIALASSMPSELYQLVTLTQAMKIMEDAIVYTHYLPFAWEKYDQNTNTEEAKIAGARAKIILLSQLDTINSNIEHLEKAADAVMRFSEQRNRCLTSAASAKVIATTETNRYMITSNNKIAIMFEEAAATAQEAIMSFYQFAQYMKEGDVPAAFPFYVKGFSLELKAVTSELEAKGFPNTAVPYYLKDNVEKLPEEAAQARREGALEAANAFEQAADYYLQALQAAVNERKTGDMHRFFSKKEDDFSRAACYTGMAAKTLKQAAHAKRQGYEKAVKMFEKTASYEFQAAGVYLQAIQTASSADKEKAEKFSDIAFYMSDAAGSFEKAGEAKREGFGEAVEAFEQAAHYYLQAANISTKKSAWETGAFRRAGIDAKGAALSLKQAAQAKREGAIEAANVFEQSADYYFQAVQAALNEPKTGEVCSFISKRGDNFSKAASYTSRGAETLKQATRAKNQGYEEAVKMFEKAASYEVQAGQVYLKAAQAAFSADDEEARGFSDIACLIRNAAGSFEKAAQTKNEGFLDVTKVFEQAAHYYLQAAGVRPKEAGWKKGSFSGAGGYANRAAWSLKQAAQARNENKIEAAKEYDQAVQAFNQVAQSALNGEEYDSWRVHEQNAYYHQWRAEIYRQEGVEQGDAFSRQIFDEFENFEKKLWKSRSGYDIHDYGDVFSELSSADTEYRLAHRAAVADGDLEAARAHQKKAYEHYERAKILYAKHGRSFHV